jgi:DNA polymerase-3 subunit epsilon
MRYLYFDTETTSFPAANIAPLEQQPHVVQLAALLTDTNDQAEHQLNYLIRPSGWTIHPGAQEVHGISLEKAAAEGVPLWLAINAFACLCQQADVVVAHNIEFDLKVIGFEIQRLGLPDIFALKERCCTMKQTTDICRLPGKYPGKFKSPKLAEAYRHFFQEDFEGAHDAMADVRACARIHRHLLIHG